VRPQTAIFSAKPRSKNAGTKHFMFGGRFGVSQTGKVNRLRNQIKVRQPIGRTDSMQAVCSRMRKLFLYESAKNLLCSKIQDQN
jgi:hypothetical protein